MAVTKVGGGFGVEAGGGERVTEIPLVSSVLVVFSADVRAAGGPYSAVARASSATLGKRASGFFSRQRSTAASSPGGTSLRNFAMGDGFTELTITTSS